MKTYSWSALISFLIIKNMKIKQTDSSKKVFLSTLAFVFLLSFLPIFLFANSGILIVNQIWYPFPSAGYAGWIEIWYLKACLIGTFFGIGLLPNIFIFQKTKKVSTSIFLWLIFSSLGFIFTVLLSILFTLIFLVWIPIIHSWTVLMYIVGSLSFFLATFLLVYLYEFCTSLSFSRWTKIIISLSWVGFFTVYSMLFGGLEMIWTWGGTPIFRMYTIIAWHVSMSLLITIISFKLNPITGKSIDKI